VDAPMTHNPATQTAGPDGTGTPRAASVPFEVALEDHARNAVGGQPVMALPRVAVILLITAAAVIVGAGMKNAAGIVAPVVLALVLTIAVTPLRGWAQGHGWPSWAATGLAMLAVYGIVLALVLGLALAVVQLTATLPDYADNVDDLTAQATARLADLGVSASPTKTALTELDMGKLTSALTNFLTGMLGVLSSLFFLLTVLFFVTVDSASVRVRADVLHDTKPELTEALAKFVSAIRQYLLVTALFGGIVAVLDTAALWLLGVPLALVWGLLSFITNFVPNIGFIIGLIPPALLALLDGGWEAMLAVIIVYCVLNLVIQTFIQPHYVGDAVGLGTTITFLSLAVWTYLLGALGALLAVPMTLLVRAVLIDADPAAGWAVLFLGSSPKFPPEEPEVPEPAVRPGPTGDP